MLTLALALATLLSAAPQNGTVYTAEGGRLRGNVLEAGPGGVAVQLADGSTRRLEAAQVSRVDFADGTSWKPAAAAAPAAVATQAAPAAAQPAGAPPPAAAAPATAAPAAAGGATAAAGPAPQAAAPAAGAAAAPGQSPQAAAAGPGGPFAPGPAPVATAPAPAATAAAAASPAPRPATGAAPMVALPEKLDTVYLAKGGRVRGLVVEETPEGVVMRLVDGAERRFAPGQVARVVYADGTSTAPADAAPAKPTR